MKFSPKTFQTFQSFQELFHFKNDSKRICAVICAVIMDRNVESYKSEKAKLISTLEKLKERVHTVEAYDLLMKLKTEGYLKAIQDLKHPFTACSFYLIRWFRTFVGVKDEAMLLINGELMRNYHRKVHEQHLHTRGKESSYYKTGVLGLSSCSVDGMNYQFRMLAMKRKKNDCREEERMDAVGDQIRDLETRLDMLCKTVDAHVSVVKSELKKKCPYIRSITIESTYKAEHLSLHYDPKITPLRDFQYTCQEARTGSRKLALHSGIEDPTSEGVAVQRLVAPIGHHRAAVADEEDQEYARQMAQQRAAATLAEQRASELEAQKVPDFSFDYSIDKEKREFGAYELLAIPEDRDDGTYVHCCIHFL